MIPKFRVYDEKSKLMRGVAYMDFLKKEITYYIEDDIFYEQFDRKFDEVILMQSTGLKDKNGAEIFEGDIVETISEFDPERAIIKFDGVEFYLEYFDKRFEKESLKDTSIDLEIIGNIYENKE